MSYASKGWTKGQLQEANNYTDSQIALYLTSGAIPKGSWDAATNTPTIVDGIECLLE